MTREENIRAILKSNFAGFQDEIIEVAVKNIMLLDAPSERESGAWVDENGESVPFDNEGNPSRSCWCKVCGEWLVASDEYPVIGNFCPNCGADMRPKDGDEE